MAIKRVDAQASYNADRDRNRVHQQQSRARRREYVNDLEARVRTLEARDAQATEAMQLAARHVVRENQLLRELLFQGGHDSDTIAAFLASREHHPVPIPSAVSAQSATSPQPTAPPPSFSKSCTVQSCTPKEPALQPQPHPIQMSRATEINKLKDEMPCEEAARIIATMRGVDESQQDIWPELGCEQGQTCRVKNTTVFSLAS